MENFSQFSSDTSEVSTKHTEDNNHSVDFIVQGVTNNNLINNDANFATNGNVKKS